jgi:hypothetical protein
VDEDVDEDVDESSDLSCRGLRSAEAKSGRALENIDGESDAPTSQGTLDFLHDEDPFGAESSQPSPARDAKRRRVSVSPARSSVTHTSTDEPSVSPEGLPEDEREGGHQPVFRPAPRFKLAEVDVDATPLFPEAFSPRRRGARYLPGGLAAQLQSWLSEVKSWEGTRDHDAALRVTVEDVSPGGHMYLVRGTGGSGVSKGYILAGEGKLTGLERRASVEVGNVVVIEEPVWEVSLLGDMWTVGCNWSVG